MISKVSAKDARNNFSELMGRVRYGREIVIVEKQNQPMVAIVPVDQVEVLLKIQRQQEFAILDAIREKLPDIPDDEISRDIAEALKAVRTPRD